jgi:hypothetical protein
VSLAVTLGLVTGGAGIASAAEAVTAERPISIVHSGTVPAERTGVPVGAASSATQTTSGLAANDGHVQPAGVGRWILDVLIKIGRWVYDQAVAAARAGWAAFVAWWNGLASWVRYLIPVGAEELFRAIGCHVLNQHWLC